MIDRIFAPLLTFVMLVASTAAFAAILLASPRTEETVVAQGMPPAAVMLETVVIDVKRTPAAPQVAGDDKPSPAPASQPAEGRSVLMHRAAD